MVRRFVFSQASRGRQKLVGMTIGGRRPYAVLVPEADKRGKAEMVDEAMQWIKSHEPSKQE
jgi:hypothetical protein